MFKIPKNQFMNSTKPKWQSSNGQHTFIIGINSSEMFQRFQKCLKDCFLGHPVYGVIFWIHSFTKEKRKICKIVHK